LFWLCGEQVFGGMTCEWFGGQMFKVGDLVKTIEGWCAIEYVGIVIGIEASSSHVNVALTKRTTLGAATHWFPIQKVEMVNAGR
tara:strand:+ start:802 stop:1053 length:252 start_codon:yes stop_codon:yes gene_type:complete